MCFVLTKSLSQIHTCIYETVTLVLPIPHPHIPEQHEPWCPLGKKIQHKFQFVSIFQWFI